MQPNASGRNAGTGRVDEALRRQSLSPICLHCIVRAAYMDLCAAPPAVLEGLDRRCNMQPSPGAAALHPRPLLRRRLGLYVVQLDFV